MLENEGNEIGELDVNEASSEPAESQEAAPKAAPTETQTDTQDNTPFHKHPRWIERDNELKAERQARQELEKRYEDVDRRLQELSKPTAPQGPDKRAALIERLKTIDPEFAEVFAQLVPSQDVEQLKRDLQQRQVEDTRKQGMDTISRLHSEHKVPENLHKRYLNEIQVAIAANPKLKLSDLPTVYKQVHDEYTQLIDGIKRAERESYVKTKKADAAAPASQAKGQAVKPSGKSEWSDNPDENRSNLIKSISKSLRESNSV